MKKLMIAMTLLAACSLTVQADGYNGDSVNFNERTVGEFDPTDGDDGAVSTLWARSPEDAAGDSEIMAYAGDETNKYLKINEANVLMRKLDTAAVAIPTNGGISVATRVQFTAQDAEDPAPDVSDAKIAIWAMKEEGEEGSEGKKYLMVTAGASSDDVSNTVFKTNFELATDDATWYNIVVKSENGSNGAIFTITVDGTVVKTEDETTDKFQSLVAKGETGFNTIASLGFKGTGAADDLVFSSYENEQPIPVKVTTAPEDAIWNLDLLSYSIDGAEAVEFGSDGFSVMASKITDNITIVAKGEGYKDYEKVYTKEQFLALGGNLEIVMEPAATEIEVKAPTGTGWTATVAPTKAALGTEITVTYTADAGKLFKNGETTMTAKGTLAEGGDVEFAEEPDTETDDAKAKIGTVLYLTLNAAIEAADGTADVVLLASCAGDGIKIDKSITIDFGGFTYTVDAGLVGSPSTQSQAFNLVKGNTITLKNGTISSTVARMLVQNYASLTLDNMTLDGEKLSAKNGNGKDYVAYTLSNCAGDTVIKGNTVIKARILDGQTSFAFDTYYQEGKYVDATVTVDGATIYGDIELAGGSLTLTAGTLNGALVEGSNIEKGVVTKGKGFTADAPTGYQWNEETGILEPIPPAPTYTVTFSTNTVDVADAKLTNVESGTELKEEQIPDFGDGTWDVDPLGAIITCNTNFNFTVKSEQPVVEPIDVPAGETVEDVVTNATSEAVIKVNDPTQITIDNTEHTVQIGNQAPIKVADYYNVSIAGEEGAQKTLKFELNENAKAEPATVEDAEGKEIPAVAVAEDEVGVGVATKVGLWYALETKASLDAEKWTIVEGSWVQGDGKGKALEAEAAGAQGFYRVVVSDIAPKNK